MRVILPKLFRRLAAYLQNGGSVVGFKQEFAESTEPIVIIFSAHATHFDTNIEEGITIRMTEPPENVMFMGYATC